MGEVVTLPYSSSYSHHFEIASHRIYDSDNGKYNGEHNGLVSGKIQVRLSSELRPPERGDHVLLRGKINLPASLKNPGQLDYKAYLANKGIFVRLDAEEMMMVYPGTGIWHHIQSSLDRLRWFIDRLLEQQINQEEPRAVLKALLIGDQAEISKPIKQSFQKTGLTHVLAISGLHVMLVGLVVYQLLRPVFVRLGLSWKQGERLRAIITLLVLLIYMMIAGAKASVVRAVLMATFMIVGALFQRPVSLVNTLSAAALVLLVYRPLYIFDIGFQLSFAAVLSIVLLAPVLASALQNIFRRKLRARWVRGALDGMLVSIAATLGTLPILVYHFGTVSFAGIVLNPFALPLTAGSLSAGILMVLCAPLSPQLAALMANSSELLASLLIVVAEQGTNLLAFLSFSLIDISSASLFLFTMLLAAIVVSNNPQYRWRFVLFYLAMILCVQITRIFRQTNRPSISVVFFDVGHGDAALIQLPDEKHVLVDTGNKNEYTDIANQVILPFLKRARIEYLDGILITHPHQDHMGGLQVLLDSIPVENLYLSQASIDSRSFTLKSIAGKPAPHIVPVIAGVTIPTSSSVRLRILSPTTALDHHENVNESSIVLELQFGETRFLFMGDAEAEAERSLLQNYPAFLHSDIVKSGHHGSITSSSQSLVSNALLPPKSDATAFISVGRRSYYGLPDSLVVARWRDTGAKIHSTADAGALWVKSNGEKVWTMDY